MNTQKVSTQNLKTIAETMQREGCFFPYVRGRQLLDCAGEVLLTTGEIVEITVPAYISAEEIQKAIIASAYSMAVKRVNHNFNNRVAEYRRLQILESGNKIKGEYKSTNSSSLIQRLTNFVFGLSNQWELRILGLSQIPSHQSVLSEAYRKALKKHHPEFGGKEKSLWTITSAYETLMASIDNPQP